VIENEARRSGSVSGVRTEAISAVPVPQASRQGFDVAEAVQIRRPIPPQKVEILG
jgi:hypothetical protein